MEENPTKGFSRVSYKEINYFYGYFFTYAIKIITCIFKQSVFQSSAIAIEIILSYIEFYPYLIVL